MKSGLLLLCGFLSILSNDQKYEIIVTNRKIKNLYSILYFKGIKKTNNSISFTPYCVQVYNTCLY